MIYWNVPAEGVLTKWQWVEQTTEPQFEPVYKWAVGESRVA